MTASVIAWMAAVQGLMAVAPDVILFAAKVKGWINDLFSTGVISADVQNALHQRVSAICAATLTKQIPPHWQVEADPEA